MRTIFKIGMTVYDRVVFPNMEGKVVDINVCSSFPVKVRREDGSDFYRVSIIETNPYGLSDPCLFKSYKELETTSINFRFS